MKILELTHYSSGICGVWQRVKQESDMLSKKHKVTIFSSNLVKGSDKISSENDSVGKIKIKRFYAKKFGGEGFLEWNFYKKAIKLKPDIIIAHSYRQIHTIKALKIARKIGAKVFLVTHAPFDRNDTRSLVSKIIVKFYDKFVGSKTINKFDKILIVSKWEIPYLLSLGCKKEKIVHIPNGLPKEFFSLKKHKEQQNKIIFLGRISPIKNLETLFHAIKLIDDEKIILEIVGSAERGYLEKLKSIIKKENLTNRIIFSNPIYNLKEKIAKIDSCKILVLPSKSETFGQALAEAMAREKIVISSDNKGARELITDNKNGYLFPIGNSKELAKKINFVLKNDQSKLKKQARKFVKKFSWEIIIRDLEKLLN